MRKYDEKLNIVDESGNIIGKDTRENIHKKGLLHREIWIIFYTPRGEVIFQRRSKDKDTFPGLLDATVGGHVDLDEDFKTSALKEVEEETGIKLNEKDLKQLQTIQKKSYDKVTGNTNNALRRIYIYYYKDDITNLKIEDGKNEGFVAVPLKKLFNLSEDEAKEFISFVISDLGLKIFKKIEKILKESV